MVKIEQAGPTNELAEFQVPVAVDAGVGCPAAQILGDECPDHFFFHQLGAFE